MLGPGNNVSYTINHAELTLHKEIGRGGFGAVYQGAYLHIALDTAKGLAFLHQENILHRDIKKSDIYSLGITLWELSSRKIPFADAASPELIPTWVQQGDREDIPLDCPELLHTLVQTCWEGEPAQSHLTPSFGGAQSD